MSRAPNEVDVTGDRRKRTKGERQRHAIIDALRSLVSEQSFSELTIGQIADRAGVSRQGFYVYFDSKLAALAVAVLEATAELDATLDEIGPRNQGESIDEFLGRLLGGFLVANTHHRGVIAAALEASAHNPQILSFTRSALDASVERTIRLLKADHEFPPTAPDLQATLQVLSGMAVASGPHLELVMPQDAERGTVALVGIWKHALWPVQPTA